MAGERKKIYLILAAAVVVGYVWLYFGFSAHNFQPDASPEVCIIKHVTNVPCPSCGSSRSVLSLMHGDFFGSLYLNPFGLVIAFIMLALPPWLAFDLITRKSTLLKAYKRMEEVLRKPFVAFPLIALVLVNWIWNITKGL